jgi:hypothetical protein
VCACLSHSSHQASGGPKGGRRRLGDFPLLIRPGCAKPPVDEIPMIKRSFWRPISHEEKAPVQRGEGVSGCR